MNVRQRLVKLESSVLCVSKALHIVRVVVYPGGIEPIGYRCEDGTEVMREHGDSEEDFKSRCYKALNLPTGKTSRHILHPIYDMKKQ